MTLQEVIISDTGEVQVETYSQSNLNFTVRDLVIELRKNSPTPMESHWDKLISELPDDANLKLVDVWENIASIIDLESDLEE